MSEAHLPPQWAEATLGEIAEIQGGIQKGKMRWSSLPLRDVLYLRVANVQRGYLDLDVVQSIQATEDEISQLRLQVGDVLFNEGGDRDKLGRGWIWNGALSECIHQNHVFRARIIDQILDPKLLSWYGNTVGQKYFFDQGKQTTNLASLNSSKLKALQVLVPPQAEQIRIVEAIESYLTRLDDAMATLERVQRNLKRYRASVLKAAIAGRLVPTEAELARTEGREYEPASVLLERILAERRHRWEEAELAKMEAKGKVPKNDKWKAKYLEPAGPDMRELSDLPEGWCWTRIDTVGYVQLGRQRAPAHHTGANMRPYLRVANVFEDRIDATDVMTMNFTEKEFEVYRLKYGDILLNEGQSPHLVGRPAMYRDEVPGACFTNSLVRFQASSDLDPRYALLVFLAQLHLRRYMRIAQITTNIAHLGAGRFSEIEFPLPPLAEQLRIVDEVDRLLTTSRATALAVTADLGRMSRLRQSILKWAFEGRLAVQDPNDEPAVVLLERIRAERAAGNGRKQPRARRVSTRPASA